MIAVCIAHGEPGAGVQMYDPILRVINKTNHAYTLEWTNGAANSINNMLTIQAKNHGTADIQPNQKETVIAHFLSLSDNDKILKKTHMFSLKLFNKDHVLLTESQIIHNIKQNSCGVSLNNIKIIINPEGVPIIIIDSDAKH